MLSCYTLLHYRNAALMYSDKYPEEKQHQKILRRLFYNLKEYGAFKKPVDERNKPSNSEEHKLVM